jgi:hypothetical protein
MNIDVLVAGGGSAGLAAAVSAARAGAQTLLLERGGSLGGTVTASLVHSICGLYLLSEEPEAVMAHTGFAEEFAARLLANGGATGPHRMGRVDVLLQKPTAFAVLADELCEREPNLTVRLHTELFAANVAGGANFGRAITAVETVCRGQREVIAAKAFVDTTGDAALAHLAGAECEMALTLQRPAFIFALGGVAHSVLAAEGRMQLSQRLVAGHRSGVLPAGVLGAHFRAARGGSAAWPTGEVFVTIDLDDPPDAAPYDPTQPDSLSALERYGRHLAHTLTGFLVANGKGFENAYISAFPARVGIRESRRICGETRIETEHIVSGATFEDAVALSTWPIEMRDRPTGPRLRFPEGNRPCEIPLRALRASGFSNLFAAGRCISSSHEAQAALRVVGTCFATGEAAGIAAALLAQGEPVDAATVTAVRERMSVKA